MAFNIDKNGDITLIQGDSGTINVNGLNTDKSYNVYFAIQDKNRKTVGSELQVSGNINGSVVFELTSEYTDLLTVPKNQSFEIYYYGIKQCSDDGAEDTLIIGNQTVGYQNTITVYPKKVEGA